MKEFEVSSNGNGQPYPMYFTLRGKDGPAEGQMITGSGIVTLVHTKPIEPGDSIRINAIVHTVDELLEQRTPQGNGHHKDAIFYRVTTTYKRTVTHR